jgi:hypothetical protein
MHVALRQIRFARGFVLLPGAVVCGRLAVVLGRGREMLGRFAVMLDGVGRHGLLLTAHSTTRPVPRLCPIGQTASAGSHILLASVKADLFLSGWAGVRVHF